ncbi:hypothetical protein J6590_092381 [Homalodisca vitripennis]|nr:hypothetical protein J6590_092381 [Homalodisca vitripennis]
MVRQCQKSGQEKEIRRYPPQYRPLGVEHSSLYRSLPELRPIRRQISDQLIFTISSMGKGTDSGQKRRNEFVSWLQFYLRIAGLWQISPLVDGPRILYHVIAMGLACAGGWLLFAQKYDDFSINTDVLLHAVLVAHSLMVYLVYLRKRGTICRLRRQDFFNLIKSNLF